MSSAVRPPQMPNSWPVLIAYSAQRFRMGHSAQSALAVSVACCRTSPSGMSSGKNRSGKSWQGTPPALSIASNSSLCGCPWLNILSKSRR